MIRLRLFLFPVVGLALGAWFFASGFQSAPVAIARAAEPASDDSADDSSDEAEETTADESESEETAPTADDSTTDEDSSEDAATSDDDSDIGDPPGPDEEPAAEKSDAEKPEDDGPALEGKKDAKEPSAEKSEDSADESKEEQDEIPAPVKQESPAPKKSSSPAPSVKKPADAASKNTTATADGKFQLAYQFRKGDVLRWEVVHSATIKTTIAGATQTARTRSESIKAWRIDDFTSTDEIVFTHLVEQVKMSNEISGRAEVTYDSTSDEAPPHGYEQAARAVGVPLSQFTVNRHGKVLKRLKKHIQPGQSDEVPVLIPLPEEPIEVGHVWTEPHEVRVPMEKGGVRPIQTRRRFELVRVQSDVATIKAAYQIMTPIHDPKIEAQLIQRLSEGELRFDLRTGQIISQQLDVDRRVLDVQGQASSMHYVMRFTERLLGENEKVAARPATAKTPEKKSK